VAPIVIDAADGDIEGVVLTSDGRVVVRTSKSFVGLDPTRAKPPVRVVHGGDAGALTVASVRGDRALVPGAQTAALWDLRSMKIVASLPLPREDRSWDISDDGAYVSTLGCVAPGRGALAKGECRIAVFSGVDGKSLATPFVARPTLGVEGDAVAPGYTRVFPGGRYVIATKYSTPSLVRAVYDVTTGREALFDPDIGTYPRVQHFEALVGADTLLFSRHDGARLYDLAKRRVVASKEHAPKGPIDVRRAFVHTHVPGTLTVASVWAIGPTVYLWDAGLQRGSTVPLAGKVDPCLDTCSLAPHDGARWTIVGAPRETLVDLGTGQATIGEGAGPFAVWKVDDAERTGESVLVEQHEGTCVLRKGGKVTPLSPVFCDGDGQLSLRGGRLAASGMKVVRVFDTDRREVVIAIGDDGAR